MKKYLFLSLLISIGSLFSQNSSLLQPVDEAADDVYGKVYDDNNSAAMYSEAIKEPHEPESPNISSTQNNQEITTSISDNLFRYSQHSIKPCENIQQPSSSEKNSSQNLTSNFITATNNNIAPTSHSLFKNPSAWWSSRTNEQKSALVKTAVFIAGCSVATFFPEYSIGEKLLVLVCLPCVIELGETMANAISAFS